MGRLRLKAAECKCKGIKGYLKEHLINGMIDITMTKKLIKEIPVVKKTGKITGLTVMSWVKRVKTQRLQSTNLGNLKEKWTFT